MLYILTILHVFINNFYSNTIYFNDLTTTHINYYKIIASTLYEKLKPL